MSDSLPSFGLPPVNEVVMGVQFEALDKLLAPHVGKFWALVESDYPKCSDNPPIIPQIENFEQVAAVLRPRLKLSSKPDMPRVFLEDATGNWLMQVQRDRFLHNWRISNDQAEYPRYPEVKQRFIKGWESFCEFIRINGLGTIQINQIEITYLNQISAASSHIGDVFPDFEWRDSNRNLTRPESVEVSCSFKSEREPKRLRVNIKPAIQDDEQIMQFELTVRGHLINRESLEEWFDMSRRWIVTAFADLTSKTWHEKWRRDQ